MKLHQRIQVVAELLGRPLSDGAILLMVEALAGWPEAAVVAALERVALEADRLSLGEVLRRMPGAAPGADEAWAIASAATVEDATVVWTDAISAAYGAVRHMTDRVAARMAFRDVYQRLASEERGPPRWWVSAGHDASQRERVLREAVELGRLPRSELARWYLPESTAPTLRLVAGDEQAVAPEEAGRIGSALLASLRGGL